jgi:hypothetical protein
MAFAREDWFFMGGPQPPVLSLIYRQQTGITLGLPSCYRTHGGATPSTFTVQPLNKASFVLNSHCRGQYVMRTGITAHIS